MAKFILFGLFLLLGGVFLFNISQNETQDLAQLENRELETSHSSQSPKVTKFLNKQQIKQFQSSTEERDLERSAEDQEGSQGSKLAQGEEGDSLSDPQGEEERETELDPPNQISDADRVAIEALKKIDDGDVEGGIKALKDVLAQDPDNNVALEELGMHFMDSGNLDQASLYFEKLLRKEPTNPVAINEMTHLLEQRDGMGEAENFLRELQHNHPESPAILAALADNLATQGKMMESVRIREKLISTPGVTGHELESIANDYQELGETEKAVGLMERAVGLQEKKCAHRSSGDCQKELAWTKLNFANSLLSAGRCSQAKEELNTFPQEASDIRQAPEYAAFEDKLRKHCP